MKIPKKFIADNAKILKFHVAPADPISAEIGDCYFNTSDNVIKLYDGTTWRILAFVS